jgi:hypothetical protein
MKKDEIIEIVLSSLRDLPGMAGGDSQSDRCAQARVKERQIHFYEILEVTDM